MNELRLRHRGTELHVRPGDEITIGSDPSATLTVSHPGVSKKHGRVAFESGRWRYRDQGSTNGSYLEGVRIDAAVVDAPITVLLGHESEGEPIELVPEGGLAVGTDASVLRRIEIGVWIVAAAALGGLVVAIIELVS